MKIINVAKKYTSKAAFVVGTSVMSFTAAAEGTSVGDSIKAAVLSGTQNYQVVVVGLIALCALGFGLSRITSSMR